MVSAMPALQNTKADTDWSRREEELRELCDKHRRNDGRWFNPW